MKAITNHLSGGALLFDLAPRRFVINDFNAELICAYRCFTDENAFSRLLEKLDYHQRHHSENYFYQIRDMDKDPMFLSLPIYERAARMIYLNKACFNGLYRVNGKGYFNVPSGKKETVTCYEEKNLIEIKKFFKESTLEIMNGDFADSLKTVNANDFVYFDPPYDTWEKKTSFTSYAKNAFGKEEQKRLADCFASLSKRGAYLMLSNHNTEYIRELYKDFNIHVVEARRSINSDGKKRGAVEEVIVTNYGD